MKHKQYITISIFSIACITVGLFSILPFFSSIIGSVGFLSFFLFNGVYGSTFLSTANKTLSFFISILSIFFSIIILHSIVYLLYQSNSFTILLTFVIFNIIFFFYILKNKIPEIKNITEIFKKNNQKFKLLQKKQTHIVIPLLISQALLIYKMFTTSTMEAITSPWLIFGYKFFLVYAISTVLNLFNQYYHKNNPFNFLFIFLHYFITFFIVIFAFPLGYGFDPSLHRAAENYIFSHGLIEPKTPFYIGQYALVNMIAHVTHLSVRTIDLILVPVITTIFLSIASFYSFKFGFKLKDNWSRAATLILPLYPLSSFFFTTPHNLTNLYLTLFIFLSIIYFEEKKIIFALFSLALAALFTHPLTGIFTFILLTFILIFKSSIGRIKKNIFFYVYILLSSCIIPIFFVLLQLQKGQTSLIFLPFWKNLQNFINLFKEIIKPHYFINTPVDLIFDIIYTYRLLLIPFILILSILGFYFAQKRRNLIYFYLGVVILINVFILSTSIGFKKLGNYEQLDYAKRLIYIIPLFLVPFAVYGTQKIISLLEKNKTALLISFIALSTLITASFYLTYPQRNYRVRYPGYNITKADLSAVEKIHDNTPKDKKYIVLGTTIMAAAAIEKYGFGPYYSVDNEPALYYSVPSGGILYKYYAKMLYEGQKRAYMQEIMKKTNTDIAYFVLPFYWYGSKNMVNEAKQTADRYESIEDDKLWIFTYFRD